MFDAHRGRIREEEDSINRCYRAMAEGNIEESAECLREEYPHLRQFTHEKRLVADIAAARAKEAA